MNRLKARYIRAAYYAASSDFMDTYDYAGRKVGKAPRRLIGGMEDPAYARVWINLCREAGILPRLNEPAEVERAVERAAVRRPEIPEPTVRRIARQMLREGTLV